MIPPDLEAFVLERTTSSRTPGLSLVLLDGDETSTRHFGLRDLASRTPPDDATRYGIGSVTKLFTAVAVQRQVEEGAFGLDDPIDELLPEIAGRFPSGTAPRHLLSHGSGLPALGFSESKMSDRWFMDGQPVGGWPDVATFLLGGEHWSTAAPGERWQYSNEGYLALGALVERVSGEPYPAHVERTILTPLGMRRSTFDRGTVEGDANRVTPIMQDDDGRFVPGANLYGPVPAAGGLVATPSDLARFARLLIDRGRTPSGAELLSPAAFERWIEPQLALDPVDATPLDRSPLWDDPRRFHALGPQLVRGVPGVDGDAVGHGGGVMGGTAFVLVAPDQRRGVAVLANTHGYPLARIAMTALAALGGARPERLAFVRREQLAGELTGDYAAFRDTMRAELRPAPGGLRLTLCFRPAKREVPLTFLDHDHERGVTRCIAWGQGRPSTVTFVRSTDPDASIELRFERYAFRRRGRLPA